METRARSEGRELVLWLVGMPLTVAVATVTLSALVSATNPYSEAARNPFAPLWMVAAFGLPSAVIARALRWRRAGSWTYFALAGALAGFTGFAALAVVLIWAEGSDDLFTAIAGATWLGAARVARLTVTMAWPGAIAGLAGGIVFGFFAKWADDGR
jgi:hypothetical protein